MIKFTVDKVLLCILFSALFSNISLYAAEMSSKRPGAEIDDPRPTKRVKSTILPATEIASFDDIEVDEFVASNEITIIFFDIDNTLMRNELWFDHFGPEQQATLIDNFLTLNLLNISQREKNAFRRFLSNRDQNNLPQVLVEKSAPSLLLEFKKAGAIIIGLTARHSDLAAKTRKDLMKLGIDFTILSNLGDLQWQGEGDGQGLDNGIYFTNFHGNKIPKANILSQYLIKDIIRELNLKGTFKIYHFDDNVAEITPFENLTFVEVDSDQEKIVIEPCHYVAHDELWEEVWDEQQQIYDELSSLYDEFKLHFSKPKIDWFDTLPESEPPTGSKRFEQLYNHNF